MQPMTAQDYYRLSNFFWVLSMDLSLEGKMGIARVFSETMRECNRQHALRLNLRRAS